MSDGSAPTRPAIPKSCFDCPPARSGHLRSLIGSEQQACALTCIAVEERSPIPASLAVHNPFAVVRRGWVVRSRIDRHGNQTAVDLAGPGAIVPLRSSGKGSIATGYAAARALLCLCPDDVLAKRRAAADVAQDLLVLQQATLERVERIADARGKDRAIDKVAALLEVLSEASGPRPSPGGLPEGLQQRDVAALLQLRPETVCRSLRVLRSHEP